VKEIGSFFASRPEGSLERAKSGDVTTLHNLKSYWGAGLESIYFDGSDWKKFDEITYVIFISEFDDELNMKTPMPRMVFHYRYYKDVLFYSCIRIDSFEMEETTNTISYTSRGGFNNVSVVPQLDYKEKNIEAPASNSFATDTVAYGFSISNQNKGRFTPSSFIEGGVINVNHVEERPTTITVSKHFLAELGQAVKKALS
jgi:hypothetical protein